MARRKQPAALAVAFPAVAAAGAGAGARPNPSRTLQPCSPKGTWLLAVNAHPCEQLVCAGLCSAVSPRLHNLGRMCGS